MVSGPDVCFFTKLNLNESFENELCLSTSKARPTSNGKKAFQKTEEAIYH